MSLSESHGQTFYTVRWVDDPHRYGLARPVAEGDFDHYIRRRKGKPGLIEEWVDQEYRLTGGGFSDYQAELRGLRLCSEKLREVIESGRGASDDVQWLPAQVIDSKGEQRPYWVLHFPEDPQSLLDIEQSTFGPLGEVVRGALDPAKAAARNVLPDPNGSFVTFLVSSALRDAILAAGCEGLEMELHATTVA